MPKRAGAARLAAISPRHYNQIIERFERLGTWAWDPRSGVMRWSEGLYKTLGRDPAVFEPTAETMIAIAHPDDRWTMQELLREAGDEPAETLRLEARDGRYVWFSCHREILRQDGVTPVVVCVMHDVTALKTANAIISQRGRLLGTLVSLLDGMMWRAESSGTVLFDIGWCDFTGTTLADNRDGGWLESIHPDDRASASAAWEQAVSTTSLYSTAYRIRRQDGSYRRYEVRAAPMFDDRAAVTEWVGYCAPSQGAHGGRVRSNSSVIGRPTAKECKAARALLGLSVQDLVEISGVSSATITRFENSANLGDEPGFLIRDANLRAIYSALCRAGIVFNDLDNARASVSMK